MGLVQALVVPLLFLFGAVLMGLELLASNFLAPYFGASIYIWGSIIGSYMVFMSLGYVLGGTLARRTRRLAPLLWALLAASLWVLALPSGVKGVGEALSDAIEDPRYGSLVAMAALYAAPITLMAMISPYVIELLAPHRSRAWLNSGLVLFVSTFGSFVGTIATAFYFIDVFTISRIVVGFGAAGVVACLVALLLRPDRALARDGVEVAA